MKRMNTVNGIPLVAESDFINHAKSKTIHLTEEERTIWNAKADTSELASKVDVDTFTVHKTDATVHITDEERERWNSAAASSVSRAEMETYVAEYVAAHGSTVDLGNYQGPINLRNEKGFPVLASREGDIYLGGEGESFVRVNGRAFVVETEGNIILSDACSGVTISGKDGVAVNSQYFSVRVNTFYLGHQDGSHWADGSLSLLTGFMVSSGVIKS